MALQTQVLFHFILIYNVHYNLLVFPKNIKFSLSVTINEGFNPCSELQINQWFLKPLVSVENSGKYYKLTWTSYK